MRAFRARPKDIPRRTGCVGGSSRKEETRAGPGDVSNTDDSTETSRTLGGLSEEYEAREALSENSGHAYWKAWPPQKGRGEIEQAEKEKALEI
ncbi:hypothetical protein NDU88_008480 [Pleurodeles waltl]|uniref:Uncharacterized protein n=1 Tax=Pleurodeles waltl TaxID=8319 RepID=A0AAV7RSH6_PLEWA|nr:hypothetical protein NDU88_008480 [Pleurodeles waltl]